MFTQQSGRQVPPTDQGPTRTPGSSRAPSTGSPSPTSRWSLQGILQTRIRMRTQVTSNPGGTAAQGSGQKTTANPTGETLGPPSRPSASQNTTVGSPNLTGNTLLTLRLAQAHQDTRYRVKYRKILDNFLIINFPSSTMYAPFSSQPYNVEWRHPTCGCPTSGSSPTPILLTPLAKNGRLSKNNRRR